MMITDYQYFGSICFMELLYKEKEVFFDREAPFSKMSFKNRMVILSAQGPLHLTIPIIGGRDQKTAIKDISIAYDAPWQAQHWKAIKTCYKRAPYFEYYETDLENVYSTKNEMLVDFLDNCHQFIKTAIKGKWQIVQQIDANQENTLLAPQHNQQVKVPWQPNNFSTFAIQHPYQQVFESSIGFIPNVSILDWLFCCGGKVISTQLSE